MVTSVPSRKSSTTGMEICSSRQPRITTLVSGIQSMENVWVPMKVIRVSYGQLMSTGKQNVSCLVLVIICSWSGMSKLVCSVINDPIAQSDLNFFFVFFFRQGFRQNWSQDFSSYMQFQLQWKHGTILNRQYYGQPIRDLHHWCQNGWLLFQWKRPHPPNSINKCS